MPPYQTPELGDAPSEMVKEADKIYKGLRETKFHEETPAARESAARVMWSVLKKTWTKDPKTGKWTKKTNVVNSVYNDGVSTTYQEAMEIIGVGTDTRDDSNYDQEELRLGIETEMEHTGNSEVASRIAKDHLDENPRYYSLMKEQETVNQSIVNIALQSIYDIDKTRKSLVAMKGTGDHLVEYDLTKAIEGLDRAKTVAEMIVNGGPGSGNFGHAGRPGEVGGSAEGGGGPSKGELGGGATKNFSTRYSDVGVTEVGNYERETEGILSRAKDAGLIAHPNSRAAERHASEAADAVNSGKGGIGGTVYGSHLSTPDQMNIPMVAYGAGTTKTQVGRIEGRLVDAGFNVVKYPQGQGFLVTSKYAKPEFWKDD